MCFTASISRANEVITDDLIVDAKECVGKVCQSGESFGFSTVRIKEDNLRLEFNDTSSTRDFPAVDWRIVANDKASGGGSYFAVHQKAPSPLDTYPFRIESQAPTSSLHVTEQGRVGLGIAEPVMNLHISNSNTPGIRFSQGRFGGYETQSWDLACNEKNFFVRDATHGSALAFRIAAGAATDSLSVSSSGYVGLGMRPDPGATAPLHLRRSDGNAKVIIEETSGTRASRKLLTVKNDGASHIALLDTGSPQDSWDIVAGRSNAGTLPSQFSVAYKADSSAAGRLVIGSDGAIEVGKAVTIQPDGAISTVYQGTVTPGVFPILARLSNKGPSLIEFEDQSSSKTYHIGAGQLGAVLHAVGMRVEGNPLSQMLLSDDGGMVIGTKFNFSNDGNLVIGGVLEQNSSRATKRDISAINADTFLARVLALDIAEWSYRADRRNARHIGPMAEQFHSMFSLGRDAEGHCHF